MNAQMLPTHEDDLFGRVAVHNGLVTREQIGQCLDHMKGEVAAGRPQRSLAATLIVRGLLSSRLASAVQEAIRNHAERTEGLAEPVAGLPPEPKPLTRRAPAGDSRVTLAFKGPAKPEAERRFNVIVESDRQAATLTVDATSLAAPDSPAFEAACARLLESGQRRLFVDFSRVRSIASVIVGDLGRIQVDALAAGQTLVLKAPQHVIDIVRMIFGDVIKVVVV